jgi:hypothetical protein
MFLTKKIILNKNQNPNSLFFSLLISLFFLFVTKKSFFLAKYFKLTSNRRINKPMKESIILVNLLQRK